MNTEIVDDVAHKLYRGFDLPVMPPGILISTIFFSARRITDVHVYVNDLFEADQVIFVGATKRRRRA